MKKIGWAYQFQSVLTLMGTEILRKRLSEVKETRPKTIIRLLSSFISRTQKFSSMTIWFLTYALIIRRDQVITIELKKNYADVLLSFKKEKSGKLVMEKCCGEGLAAVKSLFGDLL